MLTLTRFCQILSTCALCCLLAACVTTLDQPKSRKVDRQKAVEAHVKLGMSYLKQGNRDGAVRSFTKALDFDRRSAEAYQGMALVHQINGEVELAEKNFQRALKGRADFSMTGIEFAYGRFLYDQKRYEEAYRYFDNSSKDLTFPRRAESLLNVGIVALKLNKPQRAKAAMEHALSINSRLSAAAIELAEMAFKDRDYAKAKRYLDQFARSSRHSPRSLWLGIRLEKIFGNKDKEASYALALKNLHPYSQEYLMYKQFSQQE